MSDFIPRAQYVDIEFYHPREMVRTEAGLTTLVGSSVGYWKGNIVLPPTLTPKEALAAIGDKDNISSIFFAEIITNDTVSDADPVWNTVRFSQTPLYYPPYQEITFTTNTDPLDVGSFISFRHIAQIDYVTARVIVDRTLQNGIYYYKLNLPIPTEFFYSDYASGYSVGLEACSNRPHVTAFFTDPSIRYSTNPDYTQISPLAWSEATGETVYKLRESVDVAGRRIIVEGGADDGKFLVIEGGTNDGDYLVTN